MIPPKPDRRPLEGLHHVTAIASDPQRNLDFYSGVLGLRLVKRTVNFDDPGSYHLYYGDALGTPGSLLTFFAWPGAPRGRTGAGEPVAVAFAVPPPALEYWEQRLADAGVEGIALEHRPEGPRLAFADPDGMRVELVADAGAPDRPHWTQGPVDAGHALRGLHGVTQHAYGIEHSAAFVTTDLGLVPEGAGEGPRFRTAGGVPPGRVELLDLPEAPRGSLGAGSIHHVAWRTPDDEAQIEWQRALAASGRHVTDVQDRVYFRSIYFREPGGVLYEIATDPPGFTVDEAPEALGSGLRLPPWLERSRARLEAALPPVRMPGGVRA